MGDPQGRAVLRASKEKWSEKALCYVVQMEVLIIPSHSSCGLNRCIQWDSDMCPQPALEREAHLHEWVPGLEDAASVEALSCPCPLLALTDTAHPHLTQRAPGCPQGLAKDSKDSG